MNMTQQDAQWWWAHSSAFSAGVLAFSVGILNGKLGLGLPQTWVDILITTGLGAMGIPAVYTAGRIKGQVQGQ